MPAARPPAAPRAGRPGAGRALHRHRGAAGLAARKMALARLAFHHLVPHHVPRLPAGAHGHSGGLAVALPALVPPASQRVLVLTPTVRDILVQRGLGNLQIWSRGWTRQVPAGREPGVQDLPRPVFLSVGRVARERTWTPSCRWTCRAARWWWAAADEARLKKKFPDAVFLGMRNDDELPGYYQAADVFVFPSLTDTFGLVMLEAMACGTPVAAFRSEAPLAVVQPGVTGCLDEELAHACREALSLDRHAVRARADAQLGRHRVRPAGGAGAADAAGRTGPAAGACGLIRAVGRIRGRMRSGLAALSRKAAKPVQCPTILRSVATIRRFPCAEHGSPGSGIPVHASRILARRDATALTFVACGGKGEHDRRGVSRCPALCAPFDLRGATP